MECTVFFLTLIFIGQSAGRRRYIDLTHPITEQLVTWPGTPEYNFTSMYYGDGLGYWFEANLFQTPEHAGTHMDSPAHFIRNGKYLDEIPLEKLVGPGVVIDIVSRASENRAAKVDVQDLKKWEETYGRIPPEAFVFLYSGWAKKYPNRTDIFGVDTSDPFSSNFSFPTFTLSASEWLIKNRNINGLGTDTPTPDLDPTFRIHQTILGADKVILEYVANLDKIPPNGTRIHAFPINLHKGTGGPMRLFATLGDDDAYMGSHAQNHLASPSLKVICHLLLFTFTFLAV